MRPEIYDGLILMAVGMITVLIALSLVAGIGHLLILAVNRWAPPPAVPVYPESDSGISPKPTQSEPDGAKLAVILAAVEAVTRGKGRIVEIVKPVSSSVEAKSKKI